MGDIKQVTFRISAEDSEHFRQFCESEGMTQAEGLSHLLQVLELSRAKTIIPAREMEIRNFEAHATALVSAFAHSLEICEDTENRVRLEFDDKLTRKDDALAALSRQCSELEKRLKDAQDVASGQNEKIVELSGMLDQANNLTAAHAGQLAAKDEVITTIQEQLDAERDKTAILAGQLETATARAGQADAMEARAMAAEAEAQRVREELSQVKARSDALEEETRMLRAELQKVQNAISQLTENHVKERDIMRDAHKKELDSARADFQQRLDELTDKIVDLARERSQTPKRGRPKKEQTDVVQKEEEES